MFPKHAFTVSDVWQCSPQLVTAEFLSPRGIHSLSQWKQPFISPPTAPMLVVLGTHRALRGVRTLLCSAPLINSIGKFGRWGPLLVIPMWGSLTLLSHDKQMLSRRSRNVCKDKTDFQRRAVVFPLGCTLASPRELKKKNPEFGPYLRPIKSELLRVGFRRGIFKCSQVVTAA